jgi:hypothetical protein
MLIKTTVANEEILYRRVPSSMGLYTFLPNGKPQIEPSAFEDRECRISVDRAKLCPSKAYDTLNRSEKGRTGGVVSLVTGDVRSTEKLVSTYGNEGASQEFDVDVEHMPIPENDAHTEIHGDPEFSQKDKKKAFRKLRHRLAELAEERAWEIIPQTL